MTLSELQILAMKAVRIRVAELNALPESELTQHLSEIAWLLQIEKAYAETHAYESMNEFIATIAKHMHDDTNITVIPSKRGRN